MSTKKTKKILAETNAPVAPKAPRPMKVRDMFGKMLVNLSSFENVLSVVCNKLESVGTESGRIFNRFENFESRREQDLKANLRDAQNKIENLEHEIHAVRSQLEFTVRANHFLRGRLETLEQVAKIEPLKPHGITDIDAANHDFKSRKPGDPLW